MLLSNEKCEKIYKKRNKNKTIFSTIRSEQRLVEIDNENINMQEATYKWHFHLAISLCEKWRSCTLYLVRGQQLLL